MRKSQVKAKSEDSPAYISTPAHAALPSHDDALRALEGMPTAWVVSYALDRVQADLPTAGPMMGGPAAVREYLVLKNASHADQHIERFSVLFLDSQHRVLALETIFTGTLTQTSVYPREVVRAAIWLNAAAVVLTHNHPSGSPTPSQADGVLTRTLKSTLDLIDVRVLDHIIVAGTQSVSMAELGLM